MAVVIAPRSSSGPTDRARRTWSIPWARTINPMRHESPPSRRISDYLHPPVRGVRGELPGYLVVLVRLPIPTVSPIAEDVE